jgi:imidazolonepropionase-like amidohydrolase
MRTRHSLAVVFAFAFAFGAAGLMLAAPLLAQRSASGAPAAGAPSATGAITAIVGATVIDGNGGAPLQDATVVVTGSRITAVGPKASVTVPAGATVIDGAGKFVTPGFVDTNVHLSLYGGGNGGANDRYETAVKYWDRNADLALEAAQMHLKYGVTTVRDSYGALLPLIETRERIKRGEAAGPRMLVAGNIVGWGGPFSVSFSVIKEQGLSLFQEQFNDFITQGAGEELMDLTPDELRVAINKYLDKGPDFLKYGGSSHWNFPTFIGFSPEAQKAIVEEVHKRNLVAEMHSTNIESLRLSLEAGVDLVQHPEVVGEREMPDSLVQLFVKNKVIGSMLVNTITGSAWKRAEKQRTEALKKRADQEKDGVGPPKAARTDAERRARMGEEQVQIQMRRLNAIKLIKAGATITLGTDNYGGAAPEFRRTPKPESQEPGLGTIIAIEGLVELGMTPAQAIVSATKNGAIACKALNDFGTIETGKLADLLVLDADPLADIKNIRKLKTIMRDGRIVDASTLPTMPIFYKALPATKEPVTTTGASAGANAR